MTKKDYRKSSSKDKHKGKGKDSMSNTIYNGILDHFN
jgi:hypothetical protein